MQAFRDDSDQASDVNTTHRFNNHVNKNPHKLFVTNLNSDISNESLNEALRKLFESKCKVYSVDAKKHFNTQYSFAFIEIDSSQDVEQVIQSFNKRQLNGKKIKVEKQLVKKDRYPPEERNYSWHSDKPDRTPKKDLACFFCQVIGHIARNCPNRNRKEKLPINSRSSKHAKEKKKSQQEKEKNVYRSRDERYKKKKQSVSSSQTSSDSSVSSSSSEDRRRKKQKKNASKKHKKSHKKSHKKRVYSSDSSSQSSVIKNSKKSRRQ